MMDPAILAAICILTCEIVLIVCVVGYIIWMSHTRKKKEKEIERNRENEDQSGRTPNGLGSNVVEEPKIILPTDYFRPISIIPPTEENHEDSPDIVADPIYVNHNFIPDESQNSADGPGDTGDQNELQEANEDGGKCVPPLAEEEPVEATTADEVSNENAVDEHPQHTLDVGSGGAKFAEVGDDANVDDLDNDQNGSASQRDEEEDASKEPYSGSPLECEEDHDEKHTLEDVREDEDHGHFEQDLPPPPAHFTPTQSSVDIGPGIKLSVIIQPGDGGQPFNPTVHVSGKMMDSDDDNGHRSLRSSVSSSWLPSTYSQHSAKNGDIEVIRRPDEPPAEKISSRNGDKRAGSSTTSSSDNGTANDDVTQGEEAIAGVINVTSGEKLTVCQAAAQGLIPRKAAMLLLEAQAATGSLVNPRNGVKLSVDDAVHMGVVDDSYRQALTAAEGAFYGYLDPRSDQSVTLAMAIARGIFPCAHGMRLLEFQLATGGIIDPWTGDRYRLAGAVKKGLVDSETAHVLESAPDVMDFFDPSIAQKLGYRELMAKCVRDLDTGLRFLYIEEKQRATARFQPDLLTFRSAFRRKVTLQELIDAGLVENRVLDAFQEGEINKEDLRDILQPYLMGGEPIAGVLNKATNAVMSISQAAGQGLLGRNTAQELLEAQAATGSIVDPLSGKKMSVNGAAKAGLIGRKFFAVLKQAERAVHGYIDPATGRLISLFEAMRKGMVLEIHGIRLLEAQLATGGLIDPQAGYRIPASVALERELLDQRLAEVLSNSRSDLKGYFDPNSGENLTYAELLSTCVRSKKHGGFPLLPVHPRGPVASTFRSLPHNNRTSSSKH